MEEQLTPINDKLVALSSLKWYNQYINEDVIAPMQAEINSLGTRVTELERTIGELTATTTVHSITFELTDVTASNKVYTIEHGKPFETTISPKSGYGITDVAVSMGGADVTEDAYSDGTISIPSVTGDIVITAVAEYIVIYRNITGNYTNATPSNTSDRVEDGKMYRNKVTITEGYKMSSVIVTMGGVDITDTAYEDGWVTIERVTGDITINVIAVELGQYSITNSLTNATNSNSSTVITEGEPYTASIGCDEHHTLSTVTVAMGGTDVTGLYYSNGTISIPNVTGDIVITATADMVMFSVTSNLDNVTLRNSAAAIGSGEGYYNTFVLGDGYDMSNVVVLMGGKNVTGAAYDPTNKTITISSVDGDIEITAAAGLRSYSIVPSYTNVIGDNTAESVVHGSPYVNNLTIGQDYNMGAVTVTMGGEDITSTAYDGALNRITIESVTGNVAITASATEKVYRTITNNLVNTETSNQSERVEDGMAYSATITFDQEEYENLTVHVFMGGEDVTPSVYSNGSITIAEVTGNIVVNAAAEPITYSVSLTLNNANISNTASSAVRHSTYTAVVTPMDGYEIETVAVTMGGEEVSIVGNNIVITDVLGDIEIVAIAKVDDGEDDGPNEDIEKEETQTGADLIPSKYYIDNAAYKTTKAPYYIIVPKKDMEITTWATAVGRSYTTSTTNSVLGICTPKVSEWNFDYTEETILAGPTTVELQGYASSSRTTLQWFDGTKGHTSASDGGIQSVYGEPVTIAGEQFYKYTCRLANGEKIHLKKGHPYTFGIYVGQFNANDEQTAFPVFETTEGTSYPWMALGDNNFNGQANATNYKGIEPLTDFNDLNDNDSDDNFLPYVWFDGEVFTAMGRQIEEEEPVSRYSMAETTSIPSLSKTEFNYLWEVKNKMSSTDRVAYVIRHSARGEQTGASGGLTDEGIALATKLGQALNDERDHSHDIYGSTDSVRTKQTAYYVAEERYPEMYGAYTEIPAGPNVINGEYFTDETNWDIMQNFYKNNTDYVDKKAKNLCSRICEITESSKFAMYISHDSLCVPLVEWATDESVNVRSNDWINFMSGIAIVTHEDDTYEVFPVKVFDDGLSCTGSMTSKRNTVGMDAEIARLHNSETPTVPHAWDSDFGSGISNVSNDSYGWYELYNTNGVLRAVLREPDNTIAMGAFVMDFGKEIDLTDGAYLSVNMKSLGSDPHDSTAIKDNSGTVVKWNSNNNPTFRLVDADGNKSNWIDVSDSGVISSSSGSLSTTGCNFTDSDVSSYIGASFDKTRVCAIECSIVIWSSKADNTSNFKQRNKGIDITSIRVSSHIGACGEDTCQPNVGDGTDDNEAYVLTTWEEDFSNGVGMVSNDANGWYDIDESEGKLRSVLREPSAASILATFKIATPLPLDLSEGAYLSIDVQGISAEPNSANSVTGSWNGFNCFSLRLYDADGATSQWMDIGADGFGDNEHGISGSANVSLQNIGTYLTGLDRSRIAGIEITLIGWPSASVSYKTRDKGVYVDNIRLSSNTTDNMTLPNTLNGTKEYKRINATYSNLSTTDFNDAADVYQSVKTSQGDRVMFIVRHSERDSTSGKDTGLNSNGLSLVNTTAAPKLVGAPFANSSNDAYYSTNVKRTVETSYFIGKNRGAAGCTSTSLLGSNWESETAVDHSGDSSSSITWVAATPGPHTYFNDKFTGGTSWPTAQNYYKNNKATCTQKCVEAINWLAEDSDGHPFTFCTSHDLCMVPFVCWATDNGDMFSTWNNDYDTNPSGWLNYMAGIAVIVHSNGNWEVYPVKCLNSGKFA